MDPDQQLPWPQGDPPPNNPRPSNSSPFRSQHILRQNRRLPCPPRAAHSEPLLILSANVRRDPTAHTVLLHTAFQQKVDVVLVQEPYIGQDLERLMTKWHPAYQTICPLTSWETWPRVMTYAQKNRKHLQCNPAPLDPHLDLVSIDISTPCDFKMRVYNVYNAGPSSARTGEAVEALTNCVDTTGNAILIGDFNLHHKHWELLPNTARRTLQARRWADWCKEHGLALQNKHGEATHNLGGVLDLAWTTSSLHRAQTVTARVARDIPTPSNHEVMRILVDGGIRACYEKQGRFQLDTIDAGRFIDTLRRLTPTLGKKKGVPFSPNRAVKTGPPRRPGRKTHRRTTDRPGSLSWTMFRPCAGIRMVEPGLQGSSTRLLPSPEENPGRPRSRFAWEQRIL